MPHITHNLARHRVGRSHRVILALLLALTACAQAPLQADLTRVQAYRQSAPTQPAALATAERELPLGLGHAGGSARLYLPQDRAARGLVLYLPPLGETAAAGARWPRIWAQGGDAVLVIQALSEDAQAWTSPQARSGAFLAVARARFDPALHAERAEALSAIVRELLARPDLAALPWSRCMLAGADLGAATVQRLLPTLASSGKAAASNVPVVRQDGFPLACHGAIIISPWPAGTTPDAQAAAPAPAGASGPAVSGPGGRPPLLVISSQQDLDEAGLVTEVAQRRRAFDSFARHGGDAYLELGSASHRWLAGLEGPPPPLPMPDEGREDSAGARRERSNARTRAPAPEMLEEDQTPEQRRVQGERLRAELRDRAQMRQQAMTAEALRAVSFATITRTYLDASLGGQAAALDWLRERAANWLAAPDRIKLRPSRADDAS